MQSAFINTQTKKYLNIKTKTLSDQREKCWIRTKNYNIEVHCVWYAMIYSDAVSAVISQFPIDNCKLWKYVSMLVSMAIGCLEMHLGTFITSDFKRRSVKMGISNEYFYGLSIESNLRKSSISVLWWHNFTACHSRLEFLWYNSISCRSNCRNLESSIHSEDLKHQLHNKAKFVWQELIQLINH